MNSPLISIVMPAYNASKFIEAAVSSVKAQTYENWELIIVDDRSSDDTPAMIDAMQSEKIRVFHNPENMKTARTRNFAVSQAKGEWIALLDSDDAWTEDKLQKQVELLNRTPEAVLLFTGSAFMDEEGKRKDFILHAPEKIDFNEILKQNLVSNSSVLVKKEYLVKHPFPQGAVIHEDFAVWIEILREVPYAYGIDEPLLIYRISSNQKSGNKLKAAHMNWNTYRYCGLSVIRSAVSMVSYTIRSLKKYSQLK